MDVVQVVGAIVDELRDVVVDAGLGRLERRLARDRVGAAIGLAAHGVDEQDREQGDERDDEDDEHHRHALLLPDDGTPRHNGTSVVRRVTLVE
jgi:hypothetical protein